MRISDWSSDVCSSDLLEQVAVAVRDPCEIERIAARRGSRTDAQRVEQLARARFVDAGHAFRRVANPFILKQRAECGGRSEEHTSELQSLNRISYAVFRSKNKSKIRKRPSKYVNQNERNTINNEENRQRETKNKRHN